MDAVRSRIVVYDGGDIVFGQKGQTSGCSTQWMQWNSGIWWWGHCLCCKNVKPVDAVGSGCSGIVVYGGGDIIHCVTASTAFTGLTFLHQRQCPYHHISLFPLCPRHTVSTGLTFLHQRTMSPPPYTTIPLHTASTASTGLTFLHQRQCPHHHIPLFHCILHQLRPLV